VRKRVTARVRRKRRRRKKKRNTALGPSCGIQTLLV
jgi:hypothetical protein